MPEEIIIRATADYMELANEERGTGPSGQYMFFLWHGGEPCLAGIDFFRRILRLQESTGRSDFMINSMATNGTLLDEEWADFLYQNRFRVSISLDGPKYIHDKHRISMCGKPTFDKVMEGIERLRACNQEFGTLCVISEESVQKVDELFHFFIVNGLRRLAFLPRITKKSWLRSDLYAYFMVRLFDLWIQRDDPCIYIREFENIIHELLGGRAELCEYNGCCGSYLAIDCIGDVYLCDLFIGDKSMRIGNVLKTHLKDMLDSPDTLHKISRKIQMNDDCEDCQFFRVCKGGCLYRRLLPSGLTSDKDLYCEVRKQVISHIGKSISEIIRRPNKSNPKKKRIRSPFVQERHLLQNYIRNTNNSRRL
jgi:uncharacterized protein